MLNILPSIRAQRVMLTLGAIGALGLTPAAAQAQNAESAANEASALVPVPTAATAAPAQGDSFTAAITAIRAGRWADARNLIDAMRDHDLAAFARSELFLAGNSPRVEGADLARLAAEAPSLPQAERLNRLAGRRGVSDLADLPLAQPLTWAGASSRRGLPRSVDDPALGSLGRNIQDRITNDDPVGAEAALTGAVDRLSSDARTEWQYRVAWSYYIENDDAAARRMAALAQAGSGNWLAMAHWVQGLASWRSGDCRAAMSAFRNVAGQADNPETEAAGQFWFARSATACGEPHESEPALRRAAALAETFYGQLAAETLGITPNLGQPMEREDLRRVAALPNVRAARALAAMGETDLADETLRHQARIGDTRDFRALLAIAARLNLPATQLYLAHNTPGGITPDAVTRYPVPGWVPQSGWRVEPALLFAHSLQESQFRARVVSPAGAVGLMQVRPGTANDMGLAASGGRLTDPSVNLDLGQSYIEYLRDLPATGGLLPKVIAACNAGPAPIARWNSEVRDGGDPLLYIESIPYWETRAYVGIVLRNLWVYEQEMGRPSNVRAQLAQGQWPRVPLANDARNHDRVAAR